MVRYTTTTTMFSGNAHLVRPGGPYFSLNRLQLFLRQDIDIYDGSSKVADIWKKSVVC